VAEEAQSPATEGLPLAAAALAAAFSDAYAIGRVLVRQSKPIKVI